MRHQSYNGQSTNANVDECNNSSTSTIKADLNRNGNGNVTINCNGVDVGSSNTNINNSNEDDGINNSDLNECCTTKADQAINIGAELSVVGSPQVFGHQENSAQSQESDEERIIEHCNLLTRNDSDTLCLPTSDSGQPKRRFIQLRDLPQIFILSQQATTFADPPSHTTFPSGEQLQQAMNQWEWVDIDNLRIPTVFRGANKFVAVHIVQLKLLSKFPPNIPAEVTNRLTMVSYKMLAVEAWIFNIINAVLTKFDFGCQLFTTNDEIVRLVDVEQFYWTIKAINMSRMIEIYNDELRSANSTFLMATVTQVKNEVGADLKMLEREFLQANKDV